MKEPPNDLISEESIIGAMIIEPKIISDVVTELKSSYFYYENNGYIFKAIAYLYSKGVNIDLVTVKDKLEHMDVTVKNYKGKDKIYPYEKINLLKQIGGMTRLIEYVESVPVFNNYLEYIKIIKRNYILRNIIKVLNLTRNNIDNGLDPNEVVKLLEDNIKKIESSNIEKGTKSIGQLLTERINNLEEQLNTKEPNKLVLTGYKKIDDYCGGFVDNDLVIIGARAGMGKTSFITNIIYNNIKDNKRGVFFSLEMNEFAMSDKFIQLLSGVRGNDLRQWGRKIEEINKSGNKDKLKELINKRENDLNNIYSKIESILDSRLHIDCTPGIDPNYIRRTLNRLSMSGPIDYIVVDYMQIMKSGKKGLNATAEVTEISSQLKFISGEFNCPVIAISQLNRGLESKSDKRPMISDLRQSGKIEEDSSFILLLYRESYYDKFAPNKQLEVIIAKNRYGSCSSSYLDFNPTTGRFIEDNKINEAIEIFSK